jgi:hypothetical protein
MFMKVRKILLPIICIVLFVGVLLARSSKILEGDAHYSAVNQMQKKLQWVGERKPENAKLAAMKKAKDLSSIELKVKVLNLNQLLERKSVIDQEISLNDLVTRNKKHDLNESQSQYLEELLFERTLISIRIIDMKLGKKTS